MMGMVFFSVCAVMEVTESFQRWIFCGRSLMGTGHPDLKCFTAAVMHTIFSDWKGNYVISHHLQFHLLNASLVHVDTTPEVCTCCFCRCPITYIPGNSTLIYHIHVVIRAHPVCSARLRTPSSDQLSLCNPV